jgi:hypothetical protein
VLLGAKDAFGRHGPFPIHRIAELSDEPSPKTNARAALILTKLGHPPGPEFAARSVKCIISQVLSFQGVSLVTFGTHEHALRSAAERIVALTRRTVLDTYKEFKESLSTNLEAFKFGRPQGEEVCVCVCG